MTLKEIIIKSLKRTSKERGLRVTKPDNYLSTGHIKKADHNLVVMSDLNKLGHDDWVVITAYYAMYHSSSSLLAKIGLESKEHVTTAVVLEYFFGKELGKELIKKFNELKQKKDKIQDITIEEKYINYFWKAKRARETVQYGISMSYKRTNTVMNNAREFVTKIKLVANELDEKMVKLIDGKIKELKTEASLPEKK